MDIELSEEQKALKQSARAFLRQECPPELVRAMEGDQRGYPPQLWQGIAQKGWLAWLFPQNYGGQGRDFFDLALLVEELGYAAAPIPFFSSIVLGGIFLLEAGTAAQKRTLLPRVASGETVLTGAYESEEAAAVERMDGSFVLNGSRTFVPYAQSADWIIWVTRTRPGRAAHRGISAFFIDPREPSVRLRQLGTTAGDSLWEVNLGGLEVGPEAVIGRLHGAGRPLASLVQHATALKCIEMVGGAEAALDLTVAYAKQRVQFGRPIGSFQAVQHHCANMYRDIQMCRTLAYQACWLVGEKREAARAISVAKLKLSQAYPAITRTAHQITGAAGYYTDYPLDLYTRRAVAAAGAFGDADYHARQLAQELW